MAADITARPESIPQDDMTPARSDSALQGVEDHRSLAQFFFEHGFWDCYAEAMAVNGREPFALPDDKRIEQLWERHRDGIDAQDGQDFLDRMALANAAPELLAKLDEVLDFYDALPSEHALGEVELLDSITALLAKARGDEA